MVVQRGRHAVCGWSRGVCRRRSDALTSDCVQPVNPPQSGGGGASPVYTGPEAAATAANAGFGTANVWNGLNAGEYTQAATTNPSFSGLVDSTGAATGAGLSLTGSVKGFSGFNNGSPDAPRKDHLFFNSGNNPATSLSWVITGLVAGASDDFFAHGGNAGNSAWTMRVGAVDIGVAGSDGTAFFDSLIAAASGTISGSLLPSGTYGSDTALSRRARPRSA